MSRERKAYVLDSYALLAYLQGERGQSPVQVLLDQAQRGQILLVMCLVNLGEVLSIIERERGLMYAHRAVATIDQLSITMIPADRTLTFASAHVKARHPLAYTDAFVVALAQQERATVVTGDPEFRAVQDLVHILWL